MYNVNKHFFLHSQHYFFIPFIDMLKYILTIFIVKQHIYFTRNLSMNTSYQIKKIINILENEQQYLKKKLESLPQDGIYSFRNGKYYTWIKVDKRTNKKYYLKKSERSYAESLALSKYYTYSYIRKSKEIDLLKSYIVMQSKIKENPSDFLKETSSYAHLLKPNLSSFSEQITAWEKGDFLQNNRYPEHLIHKTLKGHFVRSKSEAIIANTLYLNKIPYRYEAELHLDDVTFYPDFTICHPETLEIIYWEHFGMMDVPQYREKAFYKLREYGNYGIIPSINLISTYETMQHPLDSSKIDYLIRDMFLMG